MEANDKPIKLFDFANWTNFETDIASLVNKIENESWKSKTPTIPPLGEKDNRYNQFSKDHPVLACYILNTYRRAAQENKICITPDLKNACFNTGLLSPSRQPIYAVFTKNNILGKQYWKFSSFLPKPDRYLSIFGILPDMCNYAKEAAKFVFDPEKEIIPNIEHILEYPWRYSLEFQQLSDVAKENLMTGALIRAKDTVKRNPGAVIPQYYLGDIQLLMPLQLMKDEPELALILEVLNDFSYRANSVLPIDWAYGNARVITKPRVDWLKT